MRILPLALAATLLAACGEGASLPWERIASGEAASPAIWAVSTEPTLEIGVLSGDEAHQLHRVTSVARLPDGGVAVANGGSGEIRMFDARGGFVRSSGKHGDGPGEWRGPDRVRVLGADTLLVVDGSLRREGFVDLEGVYLGGSPMRDDVVFPSDHWIHGRFLVDSPLRPEERGVVIPALERMGADSGAVRLARVTSGGRIWTTPWTTTDAPVEWTIHDLDGRPVAHLTTPAGFEVHDQGPDWVLGVGRDSLDVEYARLLSMDRKGDRYDPAALARAVEASREPPPTFHRVSAGTHPDVSAAVRHLAMAQEVHYSERMTYAVSFDSLAAGLRPPLHLPEGVAFEPLRAGTDGWMARLVRNGGREGCMISYGRFRVLGVTSGAVICWADAADGGPAIR